MSFSFKLASLKLTQRSTSLSKFSPLNIKQQSYSSFNYSNALSFYGKNNNSLFVQQKKHTFFTPLLCNQKLTNNSVLLFQAANYGTHLQKKAIKERLQQKKYARRRREKLKKRKLAERQALKEGKEIVEEVKESKEKEEEPVVSKQDQVRNYLKRFGHINEYTFASLINGAVNVKKAESLFSVIDEYNVKPSVLLYNLLLKKSCMIKDQKRAKKYYNIIKENFIPDSYTYASIFKLCADTKNIEYSDELYKDMVAFDVPPQLECYINLIASCRGQTDSRRTDIYYDELIDNHIELSPALFVSIMKSLRYTSDPKKTDFYLEEYLNHSFPITEQFFAPLIVTCQQSSNIEKAEEYLGKMKKLGLLPGLSTITAVIACCVNSGNISKAEEYLSLIEKSKLEPNVITYYNLIATCYNAKDYIRGDKYYRTMVLEKNLAPGPYITALHKKVHDEIQIRAGAKLIFGEE